MRYFLKLFLCFFCISIGYANTPDADLIQMLNNVNTMQGHFVQTILDGRGKTLNQTQGRMSLQRPGKFRWETLQPSKQLIVTNGHKVWIYDPDLEQVTIRYLTKEAGETPALLLSNTNTTLQKNFTVQTTPSKSSVQWFLLTPKDKGNVFEAIKLGFANQHIAQMQLQDHLGHVTKIQFNGVVINSGLSPSLFVFKSPKNVDVIDETRR